MGRAGVLRGFGAVVVGVALVPVLLSGGARAQGVTTVRIGCGPGRVGALNDAVEAANREPGRRWEIVLRGGCTYSVTRAFGRVNGLTAVTGRVRISSRGAGDAVIARGRRAVGGFRVLEVEVGGRLVLDRITVRGGGGVGSGAGIFNNFGTLVLRHSTVASNHAAETGGGVFTNGESATTTLHDSAVRDNSARYGGGGLFTNSGSVTVRSGRIAANRVADGVGGGVLSNGRISRLALYDTVVTGNRATETAGGVFNAGDVTATRTRIAGNRPNDCAGSPVPVPDCPG